MSLSVCLSEEVGTIYIIYIVITNICTQLEYYYGVSQFIWILTAVQQEVSLTMTQIYVTVAFKTLFAFHFSAMALRGQPRTAGQL